MYKIVNFDKKKKKMDETIFVLKEFICICIFLFFEKLIWIV